MHDDLLVTGCFIEGATFLDEKSLVAVRSLRRSSAQFNSECVDDGGDAGAPVTVGSRPDQHRGLFVSHGESDLVEEHEQIRSKNDHARAMAFVEERARQPRLGACRNARRRASSLASAHTAQGR